MHIDWTSLVQVAVVAAAAAITLTLLVTFAIVGWSARVRSPADGREQMQAATGTALAVICLVAAGSIVCFGLYLIVA